MIASKQTETSKRPARRGQDKNVLLVAHGSIRRASSRLRVHNWVSRLRVRGVNVEVLEYFRDFPVDRLAVLGKVARRVRAVGFFPQMLERAAARSDVVLLQEVLVPSRTAARIRAAGKRLVFDASDPVNHVAPDSSTLVDRIDGGRRRARRFQVLTTLADRVVVENEYLGEGIDPVKLAVIRGPVDIETFCPAPRPSLAPVVVGWTGSKGTYRYLEPLFPVLEQLAREHPTMELHLVGAPETPRLAGLETRRFSWSVAEEPRYLARFDIALAPLPEGTFTRLRGAGKLFLYMASGSAIVASPTGVGAQVIRHGENGLLASEPDEWRHALGCLLDALELRRRLGKSARADAVEQYSYDAYMPTILDVLDCKV